MGTKVAVSLANIFMSAVETEIINKSKIKPLECTQNVKYNQITPKYQPSSLLNRRILVIIKKCITLEQEITERLTKTRTLQIFSSNLKVFGNDL